MVRRALILSAALAILWATTAQAASRHVSASFEANFCAVTYFADWSPQPGQVTLRLEFTDLASGGSRIVDFAISGTDSSIANSNLIGDSYQGIDDIWRLSALVLDGGDGILAKGRSRRAAVSCTIDSV